MSLTLVIIAALLLALVTYIIGGKNGDAMGYERGLVNGTIQGRNQAKKDLQRQQDALDQISEKLNKDEAAHAESVRKFNDAAAKVVTPIKNRRRK